MSAFPLSLPIVKGSVVSLKIFLVFHMFTNTTTNNRDWYDNDPICTKLNLMHNFTRNFPKPWLRFGHDLLLANFLKESNILLIGGCS